ncbi:MAG TPA: hypothetical protein VGZ27_19795, partial [Vicinamibacterales bacterium]|nr:hypothetical protein [Vicinamibacterales bacterium]
MRQRHLATCSLFIALVTLSLSVVLAGQATAPASTSQKAWTAPRGADGHADLSGVWAHNAATPLERPAELAGKPLLTDDEVTALQRKAA